MTPLGLVLAAMGLGAWLSLRRPPSGGSVGRGAGARRLFRTAILLLAWVALLAAALWDGVGSLGPRVLLTEGTTETQVRALRDRLPRAVLALDDQDWTRILPTVERRRDLAVWLEETGGVGPDGIEVLGSGLAEWDWQRVGVGVTRWESEAELLGLTEVTWPNQVSLGSSVEISGQWLGAAGSRLRLIGPGGEEFSLEVEPEVEGARFRWNPVPKVAGRLLYELEVERSGFETARRKLPVSVEDSSYPAVVWIEDAPSFESREVRNWLSSLGAPIAVGSRITRGRSRWQHVNFEPPLAIGRDLEQELHRVDLLVIDPASWRQLSASDREAIENAIRKTGLGLLILVDLSGSTSRTDFDDLPIRGMALDNTVSEPSGGDRSDQEPRGLRLSWPGSGDAVPPLLGTDQGWLIDESTRPLVLESGGASVVAWQALDSGRVGVSGLGATFPWVLAGEATHHRRFWSGVVKALARPAAGARWTWRTGPVLVDQPFEVWLATAEPNPTVWLSEPSGQRSQLAPHEVLEGWRLDLHPREEGWHRLEGVGGESWFYASPRRDWIDWDRVARQRATEARLAHSANPMPSAWPVRSILWAVGLLLLTLVWLDERVGWIQKRAF